MDYSVAGQMLLGYLGIGLMLVVFSVAYYGAEPESYVRKEMMKYAGAV